MVKTQSLSFSNFFEWEGLLLILKLVAFVVIFRAREILKLVFFLFFFCKIGVAEPSFLLLLSCYLKPRGVIESSRYRTNLELDSIKKLETQT